MVRNDHVDDAEEKVGKAQNIFCFQIDKIIPSMKANYSNLIDILSKQSKHCKKGWFGVF